MAGRDAPQFAGASYHLKDRQAACQSAINCYAQRVDAENFIMVSSPGEVEIASLGYEVRGSCNVNGRWFVASGDKLYEMQASGSYVVRSTLKTFTGYVGMAYNRTQIAIVDGDNLYIYTLATNAIQSITTPAWRGSYDVEELDGYFIFVDPGTEQFYLSAIDDGTMLDALDFSSADASPDDIVTHRVSHQQLWLFNTLSTEIWVNSGNTDFPFTRYNSYILDVGCMGKRCAINAADTLFWIGQTDRGVGLVYMAVGNQPKRISTIAVEEALASSTDLSAATMWTYQIEGHEFIGINAPGLSSTWVFDAAVQMWHERAEFTTQWEPLRSRLITTYQGKQYSGNSLGKVVRLDSSVNNLAGRPLVRERTWPHLRLPSMEPISYHGLELQIKTGVTGSGNVTLEISNDGGETFGPKLLRSLGAVGRFVQRVRWLGLGTSTDRVFRVRCSDDVPFSVYSATVDA